MLPVLTDLPELSGRSVLVRCDFNVPLDHRPDGSARIVDDFRITSALPTLFFLLEQGATVTVATHLGRPKGRPDPAFDLGPVRERLGELAPGVELLENLRFDPGEEANDPAFVAKLCAGEDCYVNEAFSASHRSHASVVGPPARLPSAAGRLLNTEVEVLSRLRGGALRPFVAVVGGAKVADKLGVLKVLSERVDTLVVGGAMAYSFLAALGHEVAESLVDRTRLESCRALLEGPAEILLPLDTVALGMDGEVIRAGRDLPLGSSGRDIGPESAALFAAAIGGAKTVFWNGPMGVFEDPRFCEGTRVVAEAVAACSGFTVVGGGDSAAAIDELGLADAIDHVSTGGGASLEYLEHGDLPGLRALRDAAARG